MSFTLNAVAQAKGSHSNTGANDSAEPLNTTRSRSRTPGAKGGVSPTSSHHLFSREHKRHYQEMGADFFDAINRDKVRDGLVQRLAKLGFDVIFKSKDIIASYSQ